MSQHVPAEVLLGGRPSQPTAVREPFCAAGHSNKKMCLFADFLISDPRGKFVVCGSEDHSISFWDVNSKKVREYYWGLACILSTIQSEC